MFKNLKILQKVTLLSISLLIFASIIGCTGYYFTEKSNNSISTMHNSNLKTINLVDDMRLELRTSQVDLLNLILNNGDEKKQKVYSDELSSKLKGTNADITASKN